MGNRSTKDRRYRQSIKGQYAQFRANCRRDQKECTLSVNEFENLVDPNRTDRCFHCGDSFIRSVAVTNFHYQHPGPLGKPSPRALSSNRWQIDRLNPSIGYIAKNMVSCCWRCNKLKGNWRMESFYKILPVFILAESQEMNRFSYFLENLQGVPHVSNRFD